MTKDQVTATAATAMAAFTSTVTFFVTPYLDSASITLKGLATVVSAIGVYNLFKFIHRRLSLFRYRKLRGVWFYETEPYREVGYRDPNFARMEFTLDRNEDIQYRVELFKSLDALRTRSETGRVGTVHSLAFHYDVEGDFADLVYSVEYQTGVNRKGRLHIDLLHDKTLSGQWVSDIIKHGDDAESKVREVSAGIMFAAREKDFFERRQTDVKDGSV